MWGVELEPARDAAPLDQAPQALAPVRGLRAGDQPAAGPNTGPGAGQALYGAPARPGAQRLHAHCRPSRASAWWRAKLNRERRHAGPARAAPVKLLIVIGQHTTGPSSEHSTLASNRPSRASSLIEAAIGCCP